MIKYAKIINQETGLCEVGTGTNIQFYQSIGMAELDVEQSEIDNNWYLAEYCPHKTEEEKLSEAKEQKQAENVAKCKQARYNKEFTVELQEQICLFDTTEQTQADLMAAGLVTSTGTTYDNWVCNNGVVINLTAQDVQTVFTRFFMLISPLYTVEKQYAEQIEACETVEEVNAIELNYEINEA